MGDAEKVDEAARRYLPASDEAAQWDGWAFGSPIKPALEPICFAQKPIDQKTYAKNLLTHGVGAVNIDACRPGDRHPANLLHDGSDEVVALFPGNSGQRAPLIGHDKERQSPNGTFGKFAAAHDAIPKDAPGSAARFFNGFPFEADPLFYHAKASKADRAGSKHPTVKPVALMQHFVRLVTPPGGVVLDPFGGSGTTAEAARREGFDCILMEADDQYVADIRQRFGLPGDGVEDDFESLFGEESETNFDALFG